MRFGLQNVNENVCKGLASTKFLPCPYPLPSENWRKRGSRGLRKYFVHGHPMDLTEHRTTSYCCRKKPSKKKRACWNMRNSYFGTGGEKNYRKYISHTKGRGQNVNGEPRGMYINHIIVDHVHQWALRPSCNVGGRNGCTKMFLMRVFHVNHFNVVNFTLLFFNNSLFRLRINFFGCNPLQNKVCWHHFLAATISLHVSMFFPLRCWRLRTLRKRSQRWANTTPASRI